MRVARKGGAGCNSINIFRKNNALVLSMQQNTKNTIGEVIEGDILGFKTLSRLTQFFQIFFSSFLLYYKIVIFESSQSMDKRHMMRGSNINDCYYYFFL